MSALIRRTVTYTYEVPDSDEAALQARQTVRVRVGLLPILLLTRDPSTITSDQWALDTGTGIYPFLVEEQQ
jgi:hypothetical protein